MFVKKFDVKLMCQLALLVALYYLLSITLVIHTGNFKLTFISLPVIAAALLYGPGAGFTVALLGEFLAQMSGPFGLAPNTVLWLIPPCGQRPAGGTGSLRHVAEGTASGAPARGLLRRVYDMRGADQRRKHSGAVGGQSAVWLLQFRVYLRQLLAAPGQGSDCRRYCHHNRHSAGTHTSPERTGRPGGKF